MLQPSLAKLDEHAEVALITEEYVASGGEIHVIPPRLSRLGYTPEDWTRLCRGLKVATQSEITGERERRMLIAIVNKDLPLVIALTSKKHDRAIKFDIEHDRIDLATGAIRNPVAGRRAVRY